MATEVSSTAVATDEVNRPIARSNEDVFRRLILLKNFARIPPEFGVRATRPWRTSLSSTWHRLVGGEEQAGSTADMDDQRALACCAALLWEGPYMQSNISILYFRTRRHNGHRRRTSQPTCDALVSRPDSPDYGQR